MSFESNYETPPRPEPSSLAGGWLLFLESTAKRLRFDPDTSSVQLPNGVDVDHTTACRVAFDHFRDEIHPEVLEIVGRALGLSLEQAS